MPFKFNPFSGNFDQTGSGGGGGGASYIDGEVATYADLPLDGSAALNSAWLVRTASGVWPVSRKQAGIYIRTATGGSNRDADYTYAGTMPDVFSDAVLTIYDEASTTRTGQFNLGSITAGQNRVLTWPDASGRIQVEGQPIGNTTPAAGTFTTLNATNGTITASAPVLDLSQTWNNSGVTFTGMRFNVTNTSSGSESGIADFQVGGTTQIRLRRDGYVLCNGITSVSQAFIPISGSGSGPRLSVFNGFCLNRSGDYYGWNDSASITSGSTGDLRLFRDAADTFAQRRDTNPQTFRLYNTFTDASNHERGFMRWSSNVLQIGTEKAGTGSVRNLEFQTDGTTRVRIQNEGLVVPNGAVFMRNSSIDGEGDSSASIRLNPFATGHVIITTGLLRMHGSTSSFPALKRNSTTLEVRLANDSGFAPLSCGALTLNGNLDASTRNIVTDTTTGTRIGTGTTQLLGFWNATPAVQPAAVADATDAASTQARLNDLLARLRTIGLIAT